MPGRALAQGPQADEDYTGHALDEETGMHYAGARYYMSALGRWGTTDPILDEKGPGALLQQDPRLLTMSAYNYTFNDPANLLDPDGFAPEGCCDSEILSGLYDIAVGGTQAVGGGIATGVGIAQTGTPTGVTQVTGPILVAVGVANVGAGAYRAGNGVARLTLALGGDGDEIPSSGLGEFVGEQTGNKEAGQVFDAGLGFGALPYGGLTGQLGRNAVTVDLDGISAFDTGVSAGKVLDGTVFENSEDGTEGGTQAPDHRTRNEEVGIGGTVSPELRNADQ